MTFATSEATMGPGRATNQAFRHWFRTRLRARDWNMSDFARASGWPDRPGSVDPAVVAKWMRGERRPRPESCDVIADVLGADLDEVLALNGHRPRDATVDPHVADLLAKLRRVQMTNERYEIISALLDRMRLLDAADD